MAFEFYSKYDPITDKFTKPEILIAPYSGLKKYKEKDSTVDPTFKVLTKEQYDLLIDALKGGVDFSMDSDKPLSPEFLEALNIVNESVFVSDTVIKGMNQYQQLSMFHETHKHRDKFISESKELGIYNDLFEGGIISSKEMPLDKIYKSIENIIIQNQILQNQILQNQILQNHHLDMVVKQVLQDHHLDMVVKEEGGGRYRHYSRILAAVWMVQLIVYQR